MASGNRKEIEMEKATKDNLYVVEFSDSAQITIKGVFASTNPTEALKKLTGCLKGKAILRCEATKYSRSTGEPSHYDWKPFEKWDGCLWLNSFGNSPSLDKDDPLYRPLLDFLPVGKTKVIETGNEKFVVQHVPPDHQTGGTVPNHIKLTKVS